MILSEYEKRLQSVNPRLRIKRFGTSMAAVMNGNRHVCRVPQGEITSYDVTLEEIGFRQEYMSPGNPKGEYRWARLMRGGRVRTARMLLAGGLVRHSDLPKIS